MYRPLVLALLFLAGLTASVHAQTPAVAPKATIAPDSATSRPAQKSPEAVMATLMLESASRKAAAPAATVTADAISDSPNNWRMVVAALILMVAIALRRGRSRP